MSIKKSRWLIRIACAILTCSGLGKGQVAGSGSETEDIKKAVIEAWRIEMNYVRANRPTRVNGFLTGSGRGQMGTIRIKKVLSGIDSELFRCTLLEPIKGGDDWSALVNSGQAWSMSDVELNNLAYPIVAMIKGSSDRTFTVVPAVLKAKMDIEPNRIMRSSGYAIESRRSIKAGDSIPVLIVGDHVLSVEAAEDADGGETKPWFTALLDANSSQTP
jgi:transcriptional regulator CtsR